MSWKEKPSFQSDIETLKRDWGGWMEREGIDPEVMFEQSVARLTALGYPLTGPAPPPEMIRATLVEIISEMRKEHRKEGTQ